MSWAAPSLRKQLRCATGPSLSSRHPCQPGATSITMHLLNIVLATSHASKSRRCTSAFDPWRVLCSSALPSVGEAAQLLEEIGGECTLDGQGEILAAFDLGEDIKPPLDAGLQQLHSLHGLTVRLHARQ